jgi:hypothetical protein
MGIRKSTMSRDAAPVGARKRLVPLSPFSATVVLALLVGAFLFYWFQLRPIYVYRGCVVQASADARLLLRSKTQLTQGSALGQQYQQLMQKNMYLRDDYNSFLQKCLMNYGLMPASVTPAPAQAAGGASSEKRGE